MQLHETDDATLHLLGTLERVEESLDELARALSNADYSLEITEFNRKSWAAGAFADVELGKLYRGLAIFNLDGANDIYVGFAAGLGTQAKSMVTLSARGYIVLPILASHVSVGGPGTGPALVCPLDRAPAVAAGRF